jgi:LPXTG-motif cell wall-anchored protein
MRSLRQRCSAVAVSAGIMTVALGLGASPAHASATTDCSPYLSGTRNGGLSITTTPAAASSVPAGGSIQITATWDDSHFSEIDRLATCVTWDGNFHPSMSNSLRGIGTGTISSNISSVTVPEDMPVGSEICIRDVLIGDGGHTVEVSNTPCFTSPAAAAVVTTTTMAPTTTTTMAPTTTTTMAPTTTTTAAPVVIPADSTGKQAGGPTTPGEIVQGEVVTQPAPLAELPRTGADSDALVVPGGIAIGLGLLALALGRRRTVRP